MRRSVLPAAALALCLTSAGVAEAAPPETQTFTGSSTDVNVFLTTQVSECLVLSADVVFGTLRSAPNGGYDIGFYLYDPCEERLVLRGSTPESTLSPGALRIENSLKGAALTLSGPVFSEDPFEQVGTFTADIDLAFDTTRFGAGSFESFLCVPDEEDPVTYEPLPGTTYTLLRQHAASGNATGHLTHITGTLTVTLDSGQTYQFLAPETEVAGGLSQRVGVTLQQVRTFLSQEECERRSRVRHRHSG